MKSNCGKCNKTIGKSTYSLKCNGDCALWFHKKCSSTNDEEFKKIKDKKMSWFCQTCLADDENETDDNDEDTEESEEELEEIPPQKGRRSSPTKTKKITNEDLMKTLQHIENQNQLLIKKVESLEKQNKDMKKEVKTLNEEQKKMKQDIEELFSAKNKTEQEKLNKNIIISGFPETIEEDKKEEVIKKIIAITKADIKDHDFICEKFGREGKQLKVKFGDIEAKKMVMKAKKNLNIKSTSLGYKQDRTIFINHELTQWNQKLFRETREIKKEYDYKFAWISEDGKILIKKTEQGKVIEVDSFNRLNNLTNSKNDNNQ